MNENHSTEQSTGSTPPVTPPPVPPTPPAAPGNTSAGGGNDSHKAIAIIGYIVPILFFIPLLSDAKNDPFAKFHANQQLLLLIFWIAGQLVLGLIPVIGWILMPVLFIVGLVFVIMGVMNAANNKMKALPVIGKFTLIK